MGWLWRVATRPREELDRWQRAARFAYDLGRYGSKQLRHDRAPQMAAALAFRTLFALLPVLIVSMLLVRSVRGTDAFLKLIHSLFASLNLDDIRIVPPAEVLEQTSEATLSLSQWLEGLVGQAADVDLAAVGWVGVAVIVYAAIGLMVSIENSFNTIYRASHGRTWSRRIPLYWFVLTISPVAMGISWYLNNYVEAFINSSGSWQTLLAVGGVMWNIVIVWLVMFAVYALVPNTSVALRPVAIGALVAALILEAGKRSLGAYLENALSISQLYGSLGLVPLFMFWVYLMWLAILFGLEVAATLQMLRGRELEEVRQKPETTGLFDPTSVVTAMEFVAGRFATGEPATEREIAEAGGLPESTVALMLNRLVDQGLLHRVDGQNTVVTLARPPQSVTADDLIEVGYSIVDDGGLTQHSQLVERLRDAQRQLAAGTTLDSLITTPAAGG